MFEPWSLPTVANIGGKDYPIDCDWRNILRIFSYMSDPELAEVIRWQIALTLFYEGEIPVKDRPAAMAYFADFVCCGKKETGKPAPSLISWEQDGQIIIGEVNRVAGCEIREKEFLHWWTFLSYFHAIGEGQLSFLVSLRQKRLRGEKLQDWEQRYYQENRELVDLQTRYTKAELAERERLNEMLGS